MKTTTTFSIQERTLDFAVRVTRLCDELQKNRRSSAWEISRQLFRSASSIGANLHEANAAESRADFIHKVAIAHKETHETQFWLRLVERTGIMGAPRLAPLMAESREITAILTSILRKAKEKESK